MFYKDYNFLLHSQAREQKYENCFQMQLDTNKYFLYHFISFDHSELHMQLQLIFSSKLLHKGDSGGSFEKLQDEFTNISKL